MKKITTLLFALLFSTAVFAFPKYNGTFKNDIPEELYDDNKAIQYINNSGQNFYAIAAIVNEGKDPYHDFAIYFSNYSFVSKIEIILKITFKDENDLDNFIRKYLVSVNLEEDFINIRQLFIDKWKKPYKLSPKINVKNRKTLKTVVYENFYSDLL